MLHNGETTTRATAVPSVGDFTTGVLLGLLVGEGHFGGDGKQPHVSIRMHSRHEQVFRFLVGTIPGSRLYGPYNHGGRHYFQWMVRGEPLRKHLVPLLNSLPLAEIDQYALERYEKMKKDYGLD